MPGKYYEEFEVGEVIPHEIRKTVTETDNLLFSALTYNPQPLHIDRHFSEGTEHGERVVIGLVTLGFALGVSVADTTLGTTLGSLGHEVKHGKAVHIGDTLHSTTEVTAMRESKSRPDMGIVTFTHRAYNQHDEVVMTCVRTAFMMKAPKQPAAT